MSEFKVLKKDSKGNIEKAAIFDAVAFYSRFQEPQAIFDQKDMAKPTHFEWTIEIVVDEDTADAYDETSPKQTAKKMTKAQFAKKFKLTDEETGEPDDEKFKEVNVDPSLKKYFVIKKAQACQTKDGSKSLKQLQPRVVEIVDGKPVDVTFDKLMANGSQGDLLLRFTHNIQYGSFSYPSVFKAKNLIEYKSNGSGKGVDAETEDFLGGSVEFAEAPVETSSEGSPSGNEQPPFEPDDQPDFGDEPEDDLY